VKLANATLDNSIHQQEKFVERAMKLANTTLHRSIHQQNKCCDHVMN